MGKLNIAHHKSYHPYRRDNIERVRKDEEEAAQKEAQEEGRMMLADAEARIDLLRQRAGIEASSSSSSKKHKRDNDDMKILASQGSTMQPPALPTTNGHINLFEDLEQTTIAAAIRASTKKTPTSTAEEGFALAPSTKDLNPWYSSKERPVDIVDPELEGKRQRDDIRKSHHDPLTSITKQLSSRTSPPKSKPSRPSGSHSRPFSSSDKPEVTARLTRESSERERALELIRRKKREQMGSMTPSTVHGGDEEYSYGDQYNRRAVEEAHRDRDRRWSKGGGERGRGWNDDSRDRRRERGSSLGRSGLW
ncbi:hypothetical protein BDN72DRAFT_764207 [Pluteus cervinus]|uniref:Uncharacterized protein n=1 Tax=Pluteus cervinus TaxID=181527 RepID=A0ACD3B245_9AGAR|nr:hypothetical protein BDN72DRAFT_764207 [Pluteus cervinus]